MDCFYEVKEHIKNNYRWAPKHTRGSCSTENSPDKRRPRHWFSKLKTYLPNVGLLLGALDAEQLVEAGPARRRRLLRCLGLGVFSVGLGRADHRERAPPSAVEAEMRSVRRRAEAERGAEGGGGGGRGGGGEEVGGSHGEAAGRLLAWVEWRRG